MGILGVINSDSVIKESVNSAFDADQRLEYGLRFLINEEEILEFFNYDLPELVIINFSDPVINIDEIVAHIRNDKWLLNFGIIGIFSAEKTNEEILLKKYKTINILTFMEISLIRTSLRKSLQIIEENYQLIFQREFAKNNISNDSSGGFTITNDLTAAHLYAGIGATILSQRGFISPDNKMFLQSALSELIVNAIEHGNCGISFDEKRQAMEKGRSITDLVADKNRDPAVRAKRVDFRWNTQEDRTVFVIRDEGDGFDVTEYMKKIAGQDPLSLTGRGIRMAAAFSKELKYNDKGNQVDLTIIHDSSVEREIPVGFSRQQVVTVKKGDIVLRENEPGDYLYYISSGNYTIYHNNQKVGILSPRDIFMGEMAFLLNQKRSASVHAETAGKLILLTRKALVDVIRECPHYGIFLSKLLAKRLVRSNDRNATLVEQIKG
ncbi:MAG: cyclic nucleotide-binding domain-containing protein [Spirochaetaceae bacterium]|jgi:anti-sigma regulatory factor (Ser/Thr protein kinase)|nr:cyclic nucleotide-binding domain-containing protein [Spirochaetaceae bacterium]